MPFSLSPLPYAYDALEPSIDVRTMEIHYTKHHQTYTDKLNAALEAQTEWKEKSIETILCNLGQLPEDIRTAVRNNGGGFYNHNLFWENMAPAGKDTPTGQLAEAINAAFGDFASFQKQFADAAVGRFGSGWVWLIAKQDKTLAIVSTPNQDNPIMEDMTVMPILALDVWEHAYYLNYQNRRPDYVTAWWNVVNWNVVEQRYQLMVAGEQQ